MLLPHIYWKESYLSHPLRVSLIILFLLLRYTAIVNISIRGSIVASIPACHAGDPGSIPGRGAGLSHWRMGRGVEADWLPPAWSAELAAGRAPPWSSGSPLAVTGVPPATPLSRALRPRKARPKQGRPFFELQADPW